MTTEHDTHRSIGLVAAIFLSGLLILPGATAQTPLDIPRSSEDGTGSVVDAPIDPPGLAAATGGLGDLPTPDAISDAVEAACGQLLTWDLDEEGEAAGLAWRAEYARCALQTTNQQGLLDGIGDHCRNAAPVAPGPCAAQLIAATGVGPQLAALVEACTVVNHVEQDGCFYESLFDALGLDGHAVPLSGKPCPRSSGGSAEVNDVCVPQIVCEGECGLDLDNYIGVKHVRSPFEPQDACKGAKVTAEATAEASGHIFTVGVYTYWTVKASASVTVSVSWDVACDANAILEGYAWGGFMRQLEIARGMEGGPVCKYDGIIRWDCGALPGEQWKESVVATGEGAYDHQNNRGMKPPLTMRAEVTPGGQWHNEFQGSLKVITVLNRVSADISGYRDFVVKYKDDTLTAPALKI